MVPARKLVFVVDDDPGVLKAVGRILTAQGFDAELFSSAHDFHSCAQLDRATCLVLDMNLNGESGIELRRKLSKLWPSIPVIFITANDGEGSRQAAMEAGCLAYLPKPFSAKSLKDAVEMASAESQCQLPLVRTSAASAPPHGVMSLVCDFALIDDIQAKQEIRKEPQKIWHRVAEGRRHPALF